MEQHPEMDFSKAKFSWDLLCVHMCMYVCVCVRPPWCLAAHQLVMWFIHIQVSRNHPHLCLRGVKWFCLFCFLINESLGVHYFFWSLVIELESRHWGTKFPLKHETFLTVVEQPTENGRKRTLNLRVEHLPKPNVHFCFVFFSIGFLARIIWPAFLNASKTLEKLNNSNNIKPHFFF